MSSTREYQGTGIGLGICKSLIELMDGSITFKSKYGSGTTFVLNLRLKCDLGRARSDSTTVDLQESPPGRQPVHMAMHLPYCAESELLSRFCAGISERYVCVSDDANAPVPNDTAVIWYDVCQVLGDGRKRLPTNGQAMVLLHGDASFNAAGDIAATYPQTLLVRRPISYSRLPARLSHFLATLKQPHPGASSSSLVWQGKDSPEDVSKYKDISVLVAEDNLINQKVIRMILDRLGCTFTIVENGLEAVTASAKQTFDIIFMGRHWGLGRVMKVLLDIQMPVLDGLSAARKIRHREDELGPTARRTPIIALTANAMGRQTESYLQGGMDGFLSKPVVVQSIARCLDTYAIKEVNSTE